MPTVPWEYGLLNDRMGDVYTKWGTVIGIVPYGSTEHLFIPVPPLSHYFASLFRDLFVVLDENICEYRMREVSENAIAYRHRHQQAHRNYIGLQIRFG